MIKVFKLIIAVALATLVGIWATKYHGYIMLVLADKTIKMNLVAFVFIAFILLFILVLCIRIVRSAFKFPYLLFSWIIGLFSVDKHERFTDLVADITLENNRLVKKFSIGHIMRLTPRHLKDYILFRKLNVIAATKDIKELEKALNHIDSKTITYKFFEVYKLYLVQKLSEAQTKIAVMLEKNDPRFMPNIVNLAGNIALADGDDAFALKILEKYDAYLKEDLEENLIILALTAAKDANKLADIYNKSDTTKVLSRVYLEQLIKFGEIVSAEKFAKKQLANLNISAEMLKLYINAFNMPIARLCDKVLDRANHDYDSILTLLDFAMLKSDNYCFKMIYDYVERYLKDLLSAAELEKYSHILCKFFIKNGEVAGLDLSVARLVYANN
ncbi:heme biosynthesis protein HemY [Francisella hispaniensis]|uniref:heme biosynthesis protein HemY n=1 Tax=Francisella hispaniensis TaxID=622488 RepID=UPI001902E1BB|nr:heme biosynthesis protein HemY [Francisella hispaniensis]MBK2356916.1 heme biosynthesis protein HemY [Francisella hispaniensis]